MCPLNGTSGVQLLGRPGDYAPSKFKFRNKKVPIVSVSNIRDNYFYGYSKLIRFLPCMLQDFNNLRRHSIFSNYIDQFMLDLQKGPIVNHEPSENFLIADHPKEDHKEQEFKR